MAEPLGAAALLRFQNLVLLCKQLRLRVAYKVHEIAGSRADGWVDLAVVVHVLNDGAFKKYLGHCSLSDLLLFRGLLVKVGAAAAGCSPLPPRPHPSPRYASRWPMAQLACSCLTTSSPAAAAEGPAACGGGRRRRPGQAVPVLLGRRRAAGVPAQV
jgi:hypothetical protein